MKRSLAPSQQYLSKMRKLGELAVSPQPVEGVNHLDIYTLKPKVREEVDKENEEGVEHTRKNFVINKGGPPVCFGVEYVNTNKEQKNYMNGPGVLIVYFDKATLYSLDNKELKTVALSRDPEETDLDNHTESTEQTILYNPKGGSLKHKQEVFFYVGNIVMMGSRRCELKFVFPYRDYQSGAVFLRFEETKKAVIAAKKKITRPTIAAAVRPKPGAFKVPWKTDSPAARANRVLEAPLHDPRAPGAVVLYECKDVFSKNKIPVVVDPILASKLRPHQIQGVKFMFDCVMGFKGFKGNGCILADDMGLGKTLQAVTLIWTLLNQSPTGKPAVRKVLIVCPSSLVGNWCNEFNKWLGEGKINAIPFGDSNKKKAQKALAKWQYTHDPSEFVLVASYDQMRIHINEIAKVEDLDLIVCDEGHRLKNANIKASQALNSLKTPRRIILSGTPIQNDLEEFHAMVSFVNPGILQKLNVFKAVFAEPILRMREPDCDPETKEQGRLRSMELSRLTSEFILRRTSQINKKYLPPKIEHVVFIRLTEFQRHIYRTLCKAAADKEEDSKTALALVTDLKKLCNDPGLIYDAYKDKFQWPPGFKPNSFHPEISSKMNFIQKLLARIHKSGEKVVIVSNYTQTLEVLAKMCQANDWKYFQLDGSTKVAHRQLLVDKFNDPNSPEFIFLLSSKAGGCGLNLVGASSLIMADPDWNPANDAQAMARVWRPGQSKKVFLYRLLCTGSIEEKIFQRQVAKLSLADTVVNSNADAEPNFSASELRELFVFKEDTISETHDLLNCRCSGTIKKIAHHIRARAKVDALENWEHIADVDTVNKHNFFAGCKDLISFVFMKESDPAKEAEEEERAGKLPEVRVQELSFEQEEEVMNDNKDYEDDDVE